MAKMKIEKKEVAELLSKALKKDIQYDEKTQEFYYTEELKYKRGFF